MLGSSSGPPPGLPPAPPRLTLTLFDVNPKLIELFLERLQGIYIESRRSVTKRWTDAAKSSRPHTMNGPDLLLRWQGTDMILFLFHPFHATSYRPSLRKNQHIEVVIVVRNEENFVILQTEIS